MMRSFGPIAVLVYFTLLAGCGSTEQAGPSGPPPAVPVSVSIASEEVVPILIKAFGTVEEFASVEVKSQISGPLISVKFAEGSMISKGDLLFEIDARPFQEALKQAEAALNRDTAQLRLAQANLARDQASQKNAESDAQRYSQLAKEGIATRMQQDTVRTASDMATQAVRAGEAAIESIRASLEADRAMIEKARLDLSYAQIHAPISGRAGNLLVNSGNLLKANDIPLVVINQISPIFVVFGVPERQLNLITARSAGQKLPVDAEFGDSTGKVRGYLAVIDNKVDPGTGTVRLKATFDNREHLLWPGRFVNVVMTLDRRPAIVIPAEAIQAGQQGPFVFVVKEDKSVEPRPVVVGPTVEGKVVIEKGVAAGETVVTDGQSRLYPGATIQASQSAAGPGAQPQEK